MRHRVLAASLGACCAEQRRFGGGMRQRRLVLHSREAPKALHRLRAATARAPVQRASSDVTRDDAGAGLKHAWSVGSERDVAAVKAHVARPI